jgi:hypothetical protein
LEKKLGEMFGGNSGPMIDDFDTDVCLGELIWEDSEDSSERGSITESSESIGDSESGASIV